MPNMNDCKMMGRLVKDPTLNFTANGVPVCNFPMAINVYYTTQSGEKREEVCFIGIVCWGKTAESVGQHCKKGDCVLVTGRLQQRQWETPEGQKRQKHEICAESVVFIPSNKDEKKEE